MALSVEAIKSKRVVKTREYKLPDARYVSYWDGRDDRSLMSSLIARRVSSYESNKQSYTHLRTKAHIAVMNYRAGSLKPWPCTLSHNKRIHHFAGPIDPYTTI